MTWKFAVLPKILVAFIVSELAAQTQVQYMTTSDWGTGFNGQIVIRNTSSSSIRDWRLTFQFDRTLISMWDGKVISRNGNSFVVGSAGWNNEIAAGGSVTIGLGGYPGGVRTAPSGFQVTGTNVAALAPAPPPPATTPTPPPPASVSAPVAAKTRVVVTQTSRWDGGFGASITIQNQSDQTVNGWQLRFASDAAIQSLWNGRLTQQSGGYAVANESYTALIPPGGAILLGYTASGTLTATGVRDCAFNGVTCSIEIAGAVTAGTPVPTPQTPQAINLSGLPNTATQTTIPQAARSVTLALPSGAAGQWTATTNNSSVLRATVDGSTLNMAGLSAGRAALRIQELTSKSVRYIGVRVKNADGTDPGMPQYLSLGSVSEDTDEHLNFWRAFEPGAKNKRVDIRYIYLNGGPLRGWDTWTDTPGTRVTRYVRNSRMLGMIPFFVYYNIPDDAESYQLDLAHAQDARYMAAYYKNLKMALELINIESPDDVVGMILEPDFIGYLAQNANQPATAIAAATSAIYDSGVLVRGQDPSFPDTIAGLVQSINYLISKTSPQVYFGWQINLWASPAGGWSTPVPVTGIIRLTDSLGVAAGRPRIQTEAAAITSYYVQAGVTSNGAKFVSIDKYGLDATGAEQIAATDPSRSTWFWHVEHWNNYLAFARSVNITARLPVILWQLPVGHINTSQAVNPYAADGKFPLLSGQVRAHEDSAPVYFFGDTFTVPAGPRLPWFSTGQGPKLQVSGSTVTWGAHMEEAASAGVISMMFGAGVGASTTNVGAPPTDGYWWITKAQEYLAAPVLLPQPRP